MRIAANKPAKDSVEAQKEREALTGWIKRKPEILQQVWDMYKVQKVPGDTREPTTIHRSLYLDFLSKSLKETVDFNTDSKIQGLVSGKNEDEIRKMKEEGTVPHVVVFSKRYATE